MKILYIFLITRVTISVCDSSHKLDLAKWSWLEKDQIQIILIEDTF